MREGLPLVLALALWVPLGLLTTPWRLSWPLWPFSLALLALGALLAAVTRLAPERRRAPTARACGARSVLGAVTLGVSTWVHILAGGGAFFTSSHLFIGAALVLGLLLGPLALFEVTAAREPAGARRDALAALLAGWGAFLGLCVGWVQARYGGEMLAKGDVEQVLDYTLAGVWWLVEDPLWTLRHYAWAVAPAAAFTWARLRGWSVARQVALGLCASGAASSLAASDVPAVTFGLATVAIALPLVAAVADLRRLAGEGPAADAAPSRGLALAWRAAVVACALAALSLAGREAYRARRRAELARDVPARVVAWRPLAAGAPFNVEVAALTSEVAFVTRALAPGPLQADGTPLTPPAPLGPDVAADLLRRVEVAEPRVLALLAALTERLAPLEAALPDLQATFDAARENGYEVGVAADGGGGLTFTTGDSDIYGLSNSLPDLAVNLRAALASLSALKSDLQAARAALPR